MCNRGMAVQALCCPEALTAQQSQLSPGAISVESTGIAAHSANIMLLFGGVITLSGRREITGDRSTIVLLPLLAATTHPRPFNW